MQGWGQVADDTVIGALQTEGWVAFSGSQGYVPLTLQADWTRAYSDDALQLRACDISSQRHCTSGWIIFMNETTGFRAALRGETVSAAGATRQPCSCASYHDPGPPHCSLIEATPLVDQSLSKVRGGWNIIAIERRLSHCSRQST